MKNSETISLLEALNKIDIDHKYNGEDLLENIDNTSISLDRIYTKYKDRCDINLLISLFVFMIHRNIKDIRYVESILDFALDIYKDKERYAYLVNDICFKIYQEESLDVFKFWEYQDEYGSITLDGVEVILDYDTHTDNISFVDVNANIIYEDVLCIEKDLDNGLIKVIVSTKDVDKDYKILNDTNGKCKIVFDEIKNIMYEYAIQYGEY